MVVLVNVGCWRLTSDQSTVGIVKFVCGSFFILTYILYILDIWPSRLNKEDLDLRTLLFSWFLCPVFYGNLMLTSSFHSSTTSLWTIFTAPQQDGSKTAARRQQDGRKTVVGFWRRSSMKNKKRPFVCRRLYCVHVGPLFAAFFFLVSQKQR